ncbi:glycoside hydrolase family 19 protein [Duganella sp. FT92W]|uniref:Glycoside hydrolase family 19 protein n=1 Tax=Pseudoduganella rivuli TaxID=2666085 RepID=A0A7X2IMI4_9BURK|nr:glycoside hydrolase family 19 protein [Pseudoduganella rivuli]MRV72581.1 glycoside hydrolase family 19 protein [Pseudoduganella rivuli]
MTPRQLAVIMPRAPAAAFVPVLTAAMAEFGIDTPLDQAAFLATVAHESAQLTCLEENLNYSAEALMRTWPSRFPPATAAIYARQPERIGNRAYANREGNRDEGSGDGWRNRGAGAIQITFENGHAACARHFGIPRDQVAAWLRTPEGACRSAGWFWQTNGISAWANVGDFDGVSDKVNRGKKTAALGDSIGWKDRLAYYQTALKVLS